MSSYTNDFIYKYKNEIDLCNKVKDKIYGYYNMSITEINQEGIKWGS
jgi:hypothetical protein